jgi:hypothetical protein
MCDILKFHENPFITPPDVSQTDGWTVFNTRSSCCEHTKELEKKRKKKKLQPSEGLSRSADTRDLLPRNT